MLWINEQLFSVVLFLENRTGVHRLIRLLLKEASRFVPHHPKISSVLRTKALIDSAMAASFSSSEPSCTSLQSSSSFYSVTPPRSPSPPPLMDDVNVLWDFTVHSDPELSDHTTASESVPRITALLEGPLAPEDEDDDESWEEVSVETTLEDDDSSSEEEEVTSKIRWGDTTSSSDDDYDNDNGGKDLPPSSPSFNSSDSGSSDDEDFILEMEGSPPAKRQRRE